MDSTRSRVTGDHARGQGEQPAASPGTNRRPRRSKLPQDHRLGHLAQIAAPRQPSGADDNGARPLALTVQPPVTVLGVNRAFYLGADRVPEPSFLTPLHTSLARQRHARSHSLGATG